MPTPTDPPQATLPASIALSLDRVCELVDLLTGHLNAARGPGVPDWSVKEITAAKTRLCAVRAECNAMKATLAAGRMTGQAEHRQIKAESLDLHPKQLPPQVDHERLLESLHRAGDHTLDDETEGRAA